MGQIITTQNLVAIKVVRHAGQWANISEYPIFWNCSEMIAESSWVQLDGNFILLSSKFLSSDWYTWHDSFAVMMCAKFGSDLMAIIYNRTIGFFLQIWIVNKISSMKWTPGTLSINVLRPMQNGCLFTDILKCIFLNENAWILIKISSKFVPNCLINSIPALVQIMAWHWPGDKPSSEPLLA